MYECVIKVNIKISVFYRHFQLLLLHFFSDIEKCENKETPKALFLSKDK